MVRWQRDSARESARRRDQGEVIPLGEEERRRGEEGQLVAPGAGQGGGSRAPAPRTLGAEDRERGPTERAVEQDGGRFTLQQARPERAEGELWADQREEPEVQLALRPARCPGEGVEVCGELAAFDRRQDRVGRGRVALSQRRRGRAARHRADRRR